MKIAALQYSYDFPVNFEAYRNKITDIVREHVNQEVELLIFPEYAGLEILSFTNSIIDYLERYLSLFQDLSVQNKMHICAGSLEVETEEGIYNRSFFFSPNQKVSYQDKYMIIPEEIDDQIKTGKKLNLLDTDLGKIGICICYDSEFPLLVQKLTDAGANVIIVPSYTSSMHGFNRVFQSCRARALENQCYVILSSLVGQTIGGIGYGTAAVCTPIDLGFPEDGILARGEINKSDSVVTSLDMKKLETVRNQGFVRNYQDGQKLKQTKITLEEVNLKNKD